MARSGGDLELYIYVWSAVEARGWCPGWNLDQGVIGQKVKEEDCRSDELSRRCLLELSILKRFTTVMPIYFAHLVSVLNHKSLLYPV